MKNKILFIMIVMLCFSSCRKDDIVDSGTNPPIAEVLFEADVIGKIVDEDGEGVEDATVSVPGTEEVITDADGIFRLKNFNMAANRGTFLEVTADGYYESGYRIYAGGTYTRNIEMTLVKKEIAGYVDGTTGDIINVDGGLEISFPANAFTANDSEYTGTVTVFAYHLDPSEDDYLSRSPGDLSGTDETGANYILESFGMVAVEMETSDGQYVQLREGVSASLKVPVDNSLLSDAPATIPLWHFDDVQHKWVKEGQAELINGSYVGEVSHFSWWNCDDFSQAASLCIQIFDGRFQGNLSGMGVELTSSAGTATSLTDSEGNVSGLVPNDETMEINVYDQCGSLVYSGSIGPYSGDGNKEIVPVVLANVDIYSFSGTVFDCESMTTLGDAVVSMFINGLEYYVETDENGVYNTLILICEESPEYTVSALSILNATQGSATGTAVFAEDNVLDLNLCDEASYLIVNDSDGNPIISESLTVVSKLNPNEIIIWDDLTLTNTIMGVDGTTLGTHPASIQSNDVLATNDDCTITLTKIDNGAGGIVVGTIEGVNSFNGTTFTGSFTATIYE